MESRTLINGGSYNSRAGGSMFHKASNITITDSTFNAYGAGEMDDKKRIRDAMALLSSRAEQGAPYEAAAREDVPKCYEHTRVAIIDGVRSWAHSQDSDSRPLMWMYGPAGSGKTTIMQTVAEIFDKEESLAASFFFSRLSAARPTKKDNFVITLAHQLSTSIPCLQETLADALSDPSLLSKSLSKQLDTLVIGPLNSLQADQIGGRYVFMIDGLDECESDAAQRDVLKLLEQCLHQFRHRIRILVASRSLHHIQMFFSQSSIALVTDSTPLDNDYGTEEDITKYFIAEFGRIRHEHPSSRCVGGLPSDWPSLADVKILVQRASGQFIYASVVMKFIADQGRHPKDSLKKIISLKVAGEAKPYEELDAVYTQVLSTIEPQNVDFVFTLMGCMLPHYVFSFAKAVQTMDTTDVDFLFNLEPGSTDTRINRMSPLISKLTIEVETGPFATLSRDGRTGGLSFTHASFPEYLLDQSRSKGFFLDMRKIRCSLAHRSFETHSLTPVCMPIQYTIDPRAGPSLTELIQHCQEAEWTPELQNAILTFDFRTVFTPSAEWVKEYDQHIYWKGIIEWVLFITWGEYHGHIPSTDAERVRSSLHDMVRSVCSKLSSEIDMRIIAVLLTLYENINNVGSCWLKLNRLLGRREGELVVSFKSSLPIGGNDDICKASQIWLCKALAPDLEMDGSFFADRNFYTDLALIYAQCLGNRGSWFGSDKHEDGNEWQGTIGVMLSKSAPSEELATYLVQEFLQGDKLQGRSGHVQEKKEAVTAILIYLFECGVPYISEHHHAPEFDPHRQICPICLLFDPYKVECADIELSRDPTGASCAKLVKPTQDDVDLTALVNPLRQNIPAVPLFWLRVWVLWLAETMTRLFPVAT